VCRLISIASSAATDAAGHPQKGSEGRRRRRAMGKVRHTVTLVFPSRAHKEHFLGQLSDGWGENVVGLKWPRNVDLYDAAEVRVSNFGEYWEHWKRMKKLYPEGR
jgi:hypothetical protein